MNSKTPLPPCCTALVCAFLCAGDLQAGVPDTPEFVFEKVAALGEPCIPCGGDDWFVTDFETSCVNNRGQITFGANLCRKDQNGDCVEFGEGVFLCSGHGKERECRLLARAGDPAPGGGTFRRGALGLLALNELGDVAFIFSLPGEGHKTGLYLFSHELDGVVAVVRPGDQAPDCGGVFDGIYSHPWINNYGEIIFGGIVTGADIDPNNPPGVNGLGLGVFLRHRDDTISKVVCPGDQAPGGRVFDFATNPWINDLGDIAFGAHVVGEDCNAFGAIEVCTESVYVKWAGQDVKPIALQGDPAPRGGTYRLAFGPHVNNLRQVLFIADLTPAPGPIGQDLGVYLHSREEGTVAVARLGDAMPGGGGFVRSTFFTGGASLNNCGDVVFTAVLDTATLDINGDGTPDPDQGLFVWSNGTVRLVARTGTVLRSAAGEAIGTIKIFLPPFLFGSYPEGFRWTWFSTDNNDLGQILFCAALDDDSFAVFLATPEGDGHGCGPLFVRGDCNADGSTNLADAVFLLNHLFLGTTEPPCKEACDTETSGPLNLTDGIYLLNFLFLGGPPVPPPIACEGRRGVDCEAFPACP